MLSSLAAIAVGAVLGAWLRWGIGLWLNPVSALFPLGTLLVNCLGGLIIGVAAGYFMQQPSPLLRLLIMTGFCGGMTTFSTFSLEVIQLLQLQKWPAALLLASLHLFGSLICTALGLVLYQHLRPQ